MRYNVLKILLLLLIVMTFGCEKNGDAQFYTYSPQAQKSDTWIDNKQDALNSNLIFDDTVLNKRNLDSLYKTKAHYLFFVGGGDSYTKTKECYAKITKDTIFVYYKLMFKTEQEGWLDYTYLCLEIDKIKYPNYKNMNVILIPN